jgi:hypothetical protein
LPAAAPVSQTDPTKCPAGDNPLKSFPLWMPATMANYSNENSGACSADRVQLKCHESPMNTESTNVLIIQWKIERVSGGWREKCCRQPSYLVLLRNMTDHFEAIYGKSRDLETVAAAADSGRNSILEMTIRHATVPLLSCYNFAKLRFRLNNRRPLQVLILDKSALLSYFASLWRFLSWSVP